MADKRFINQKDAKIIGDNLNAINSRLNTMPKETIPSRPVRARKGIPAKITQVGEDGLYNLKEQIISNDGKSFEDKQNGRIWDGQQGNLPQALEINSNDKLDIDNIVYVWNSGSSSADKNKWFFDSGSTQGANSGVAVKNHIEIHKKKIQFKNDVEEAATDLALGPALYSELYRADVAWRYLWNKLLPGSGTLLPQASLDSSGNLDLTEFNKRQLRFAVMELQNGLRQLMIYHDVLPDDQTDDANEMWQDHTDSSANGQYWIDRAGADALADDANPLTHSEFLALLKRPQFDNIGHLKVLDGYKSPEDPYKPDEPPNTTGFKLDVQYTGTYPSSGTLFNVAISQVTKVTDENGADKVYTETDSLFWQVIPSWASIIKSALSPNIAIGEGTLGDSTNYAGASYGNNTDVNHDLARYFNTSFKLKGTIVENDVNNTSDYLVTDTLYLDSPSFQSLPASNVNFNVFCPLLDVAGGSRYSRFDGIGEYRIVGFLYWESAGFDFTNPDIQMYLAKEESDVVSFDSNTKSGANLTFNVSIDISDESDNLCLVYYLEFYNNTDAPINAYGYCFDGDGSFLFNNTCTPVANTGTNYNFTLTLTPDEISNNTESVIQGNVLSIEDLSDTIAVDLSIDDGGADTNDFSTAGKSVTIWVEYNGQEILFNDVCCNSPQNPYIGDLQPGLNNYQNLIVANHGSTTTDGYNFVLNTLEGTITDGELSLGTYVVKARVEGYEDIITKTFLVKSVSDLFCWSDNFSEAIINTTRWVVVNNNSASSTIVAGILAQNTVGSTGNETTTIVNQFSAGANPDIISETWLTSVDLSNIALPTVTSELITLLRVSQTTNNLEFGYVRDNGTNQQLLVRVNGTDEVIEDDNSSTATLTIERGDFTFSDFGGSVSYPDQKSTGLEGTVIFDARWNSLVENSDSSISLNNETLTQTYQNNDNYGWAGVEYNYDEFEGDFEVSYDFSNLVGFVDATLEAYYLLNITIQIGGLYYRIACGDTQTTQLNVNDRNTGIWYHELSQSSVNLDSTIPTSGNLLMRRTASDLYVECNGFSHTFSSVGTSAPTYFLSTYDGRTLSNDDIASVNTTNYKVLTSEDGPEKTEKYALFYKGTDLKAAYDDSGENVVSASIELDSIATQAYTQEYDNFIIQSPKGTNYCT